MTEHEKLVKEHEDTLGSGVIVRDFYFKGGYQLKKNDRFLYWRRLHRHN